MNSLFQISEALDSDEYDPSAFREFDTETPLIILCRTGSRSAMVTEFLRRNGFPNAQNLQGGIYAWNERIDTSVKKYCPT